MLMHLVEGHALHAPKNNFSNFIVKNKGVEQTVPP